MESPAQIMKEISLGGYLLMFAFVILCYDHLITFGREVTYIWKREKTASAYFFLINRYFALCGNIAEQIITSRQPKLSLESSKRALFSRQLMLPIITINVCIILSLRIYALYGRSLRMLTFMVGSAAILLAIALYMLSGQKHVNAPAELSVTFIGLSHETAIRLAVGWGSLLVYDTIVFSLTLYKTWKTRQAYALGQMPIPLVALIFRDGAIYFAVMASANLVNILDFCFSGPFLAGSLAPFASNISVSMVSRLMLNLHESADVGILTTRDSTQQITDTIRLDNLYTQDLFLSRATGDLDLEPEVNPPTRSHVLSSCHSSEPVA